MNRHNKNNSNNNSDNNCPSLLNTSPHDCVPFLELALKDHDHFFDNHDHGVPSSPRLLATHIPFSSLPSSVATSGCRVVYVCRDPKDVLISLWHFMSKLRARLQDMKAKLSLEEAYELFCRGTCPFGPYWDHVLGYWKASQLEQPKKVMFLRYEDMKREPLVYSKRMAEFLGQPFTLEEEETGVIEGISELCSFETMSNLKVNKDGVYKEDGFSTRNDVLFRQGKVGDWTNHLTLEMAEGLDRIVQQKFHGSGLALV